MFGNAALAGLSTLAMTALAVPALLPLARRIGLLDRPGGRRKHDKPVPAIGGIAILIGVSAGALWFLPMSPQLLGLGVAVAIIGAAGVADDMFRLHWPYRFAAQVAAALSMIYLADLRIENIGAVFGFSIHSLGALSAPLTILATVGVINAVNMVDGVDGLAGTLGVVTAGLLLATAAYSGDYVLVQALALVIGGLCGFLAYNLRTPWNPRARIFLGNAGSEILGLFIACATFRLTQNPEHPVSVQLAPFFMAPLLIDCLSLMLRRWRSGKSPFVGDRNHLHHMLLDAGLKPSRVVLSMAAVTLTIGLIAAFALKADLPAPCFTVTFLAMAGGYFLMTADRGKFVERVSQLSLKVGLTAPPPPLEPWQIEAKAAGRYYRRASDRPQSVDQAAEAASSKPGDHAQPPPPADADAVQASASESLEISASK